MSKSKLLMSAIMFPQQGLGLMSAQIIIFPMAHQKPTEGLPNRIRYWRQLRDRTLADLSDKIGCKRAHLSKMETGHSPVNLDWLQRIARELDVTAADLLAVDDNPWALTEKEKSIIAAGREAGPDALDPALSMLESIAKIRSEDPRIVDLDEMRRSA